MTIDRLLKESDSGPLSQPPIASSLSAAAANKPPKRLPSALNLTGFNGGMGGGDTDQKEALLEPPLAHVATAVAAPVVGDSPEKLPSMVPANACHQRPMKSRLMSTSTYGKTRRRAMFKNGECNIVLENVSKLRRRYLQDLFTTLVVTQWRWTLLVFCASFFLSWFFFGTIWYLIAFTHGDLLPENMNNATWSPCVINMHTFMASFLFSVETQHTTGFGYRMVTEECPEAVVTFCLQSIAGLMIQAFMVGIVFAKMARPKQRSQTLMFSKNAVICRRDGQLCFMFRVGDMRVKSHLIGANIRTRLIRSRVTPEGETLSPYVTHLKIHVDDYDEQMFLMWPTVVVHRIDEDSPLYGLSAAALLNEKFEVAVVLEGTTESTGQTTQARTSYLSSEVLWGHRFRPLVKYCKTKLAYEVDYSLFHDLYKVDTPLCSAKELETYLKINNSNHLK